jgi:hypothetical protein
VPSHKDDKLPSGDLWLHEIRFMGGVPDTPPVEPPTLASQGIDKNLAKRAMTSKRVHADWWDMEAEVGLFLLGVGTSIILVALIGLIWPMVPR